MKRSARSIGVMIHPASYPLARLVWAEQIRDEDDKFGRTVSLDRDFWLEFSRICKHAAARIADSPSETLAIALTVISSMITDGIDSEVKREKNSAMYASFLDFSLSVMRRTDIDRARKGQIIHDRASLIKLL
jgi:hypothetical protein